jgi:hypothetical protein
MRRVNKIVAIHNMAIFHRGALGDFNRMRASGIASNRKIATKRAKG